jgi:hypothetical protein
VQEELTQLENQNNEQSTVRHFFLKILAEGTETFG